MATSEWRPCCGSCRTEIPKSAPGLKLVCPSCKADWDGSELSDREVRIITYLDLTAKLHEVREKNGGQESPEEDGIMDQMDTAWNALDRCEIDKVEEEIKKRWPRKKDSPP